MLVEQIRKDMVNALKKGDKETKGTLSMLVSAIDLKTKENHGELDEAGEVAVLRKELKQTKETLESSPSDRTDIIEACKNRISIIESYLPSQMDENQIKVVIENVLKELSIESPLKSDKGKVMKVLMPLVKGKADGKLVNTVLETYLK